MNINGKAIADNTYDAIVIGSGISGGWAAKEGIAVDWPIRYKDIAPWYSYFEKFAGISGYKDGLSVIPDGEFLPPMEMNCLNEHVKEQLAKHYDDRHLVISRTANLTARHHDRGPSQCRSLCSRGCPFGGYFSSN